MERIDFTRYLEGEKMVSRLALKLVLLALVLVLLVLNYFQLKGNLLSSREELKSWRGRQVELEKRLSQMNLLEKKLTEKKDQLNFFKEKIPENNLNELIWEVFFSIPRGVHLTSLRVDKEKGFVLEGYLENENKRGDLEKNLSLVFPEKKKVFKLKDPQTRGTGTWFVLEVKPGREEDRDE